jgi:hypothetical protein
MYFTVFVHTTACEALMSIPVVVVGEIDKDNINAHKQPLFVRQFGWRVR